MTLSQCFSCKALEKFPHWVPPTGQQDSTVWKLVLEAVCIEGGRGPCWVWSREETWFSGELPEAHSGSRWGWTTVAPGWTWGSCERLWLSLRQMWGEEMRSWIQERLWGRRGGPGGWGRAEGRVWGLEPGSGLTTESEREKRNKNRRKWAWVKDDESSLNCVAFEK